MRQGTTDNGQQATDKGEGLKGFDDRMTDKQTYEHWLYFFC